MTEDTNGLSREQVEALRRPCECGHEPDQHGALTGCWLCAEDDERDPWCQRSFLELLWERLAPMLADARAEAWPCANYRAPTTCLTAPSSETGRCDWCRTQAEAARAEVVRDVLFVLNHEEYVASEEAEWVVPADDLIAALAPYMPAAVREGGTERLPASRDSDGPPEGERPSDGRTGPHEPVRCQTRCSQDPCRHDWSAWEGLAPIGHNCSCHVRQGPRCVVCVAIGCDDPATCGEALGDMRCQLRPGHGGGHEDYSAVAQERRG